MKEMASREKHESSLFVYLDKIHLACLATASNQLDVCLMKTHTQREHPICFYLGTRIQTIQHSMADGAKEACTWWCSSDRRPALSTPLADQTAMRFVY